MSSRQLSEKQRTSWIRLLRTPNVGAATFRSLIGRYGSAEAAIEMLPELAANGGLRVAPVVPSVASAEAELEAVSRFGARMVAIGEPGYPPMLRQMDQSPPLVTIAGSDAVFSRPAISVVGARNASLAGTKFAHLLAEELGSHGYAIVSGLARGVDTAAHQGAINSGTIAVLAGGIDHPYPPENTDLCRRIADEGGAVISEMPFGWSPRAQDFPRRNRLVAALGLGLVVVEAAQRSGSLISARLAGEMGRVVFAVPGSPLDPRSAGSNGLLKDGAVLVTSAEDVRVQIEPMLEKSDVPPPAVAEPGFGSMSGFAGETDRGIVIQALSPTPVAIDEVVRHTGLNTAQVQMILLELDLAGRLERHAGGLVSAIDAG